MLLLVPALVACGSAAPNEPTSGAPAGDAATWEIDPDRRPTIDDRTIAVLVTRLGCAGGETGRVLSPVVREEGEQVVVTFDVETLSARENTCQGNKPVPDTFVLGRPLEDRRLLDGACLSGEAVTTGSCVEGAQRWPTASSGQQAEDGVVLALIQASDGTTITWDQIDALADPYETAQSEDVTYQQLFETCYSNPDPTLRTAPLDPTAQVIVRPGNDPERTVGADQLPAEISDEAANDVPREYRAWRIRVSGGRVVEVEQAPGTGA